MCGVEKDVPSFRAHTGFLRRSSKSESRVAAPCSLASTIAHELSHIMLDSHDEAKVEKRTRLVMQQEHAVLLAQRQQTKPSLPPQ